MSEEIMRALGRIEQNTVNLEKHITSVSGKVDDVRTELRTDIKDVGDKLSQHKEDTGAHGSALKETIHEKAGLSRREGILTACAIAAVIVALMQWAQGRPADAKSTKDIYYEGRGRWDRSGGRQSTQDAPATPTAFPRPKEPRQ